MKTRVKVSTRNGLSADLLTMAMYGLWFLSFDSRVVPYYLLIA